MDDRVQALQQWAQAILGQGSANAALSLTLENLAGDASFRRYFRVVEQNRSYILVDGPPEVEDVASFVAIAKGYAAAEILVPDIIAYDVANGFMLLSDFGDCLYLQVLTEKPSSVAVLYHSALDTLHNIQSVTTINQQSLPLYDKAQLLAEMRLFDQWFVSACLSIPLDESLQILLNDVYECLCVSALQQPQVGVHLDYHSRNLMCIEGFEKPGVIDFQDARLGPISYDLVSLLKDCYIAWPKQQVDRWRQQFEQQLIDRQLLDPAQRSCFEKWFDLMGMQRHLKAIGIFARLNSRDHKPRYLQDIPRTMNYVIDVAGRYEEFTAMHTWLVTVAKPQFDKIMG